jgi:hypothetical protein
VEKKMFLIVAFSLVFFGKEIITNFGKEQFIIFQLRFWFPSNSYKQYFYWLEPMSFGPAFLKSDLCLVLVLTFEKFFGALTCQTFKPVI